MRLPAIIKKESSKLTRVLMDFILTLLANLILILMPREIILPVTKFINSIATYGAEVIKENRSISHKITGSS